jgi:hypothetical protein
MMDSAPSLCAGGSARFASSEVSWDLNHKTEPKEIVSRIFNARISDFYYAWCAALRTSITTA